MIPRGVLLCAPVAVFSVVGCADVLGFKEFREESGDGGVGDATLPSVSSEGGTAGEGGFADAGPPFEAGLSSVPCIPSCSAGQTCLNGACACDPATCAGCCTGTACSLSWPGCGLDGGACAGCDLHRSDRCAANGTCACGAGAPCAAGQECMGGACTCTATSCSEGACCGDTCAQIATDTANCGACGHSCLGASCTSGECTPTTLSTAGTPAWALTMSPTDVYWISASGVYSCPLAGCGATAAGPFAPGYTYTDASTIAYYDQDPLSEVFASVEDSSGNEVISMAPDGTNPGVYEPISGAWLLNSATSEFYWLGGTELENRAVQNDALRVLLSNINSATALGVDANNVYLGNSAGLLACPLATGQCGSSPLTIASSAPTLYIATEPDSLNVYFANQELIYRCPYTGCADPASAPAWTATQMHIAAVVADADAVYWTDTEAGSVLKCAHGASCLVPTTIASGLNEPWGIAVDDTYVYWTLYSGNIAVQRAPK